METKKLTSVPLLEETKQKAKIEAAIKGMKIYQLMQIALDEYLERQGGKNEKSNN